MGYPLRWDQLAAPQFEEQAPIQAEEPQIQRPAALRRYFVRLVVGTLAVCTLLVLTVIGIFSVRLNSHEAPALRLDSAPTGATVFAARPKIVRHLGFAVVTGHVLNRTAASLDHVEAAVDLLDAERHVLASQSAMIDRESIAPGQSAGFQVEMPDAPQAKSYRLHFRKLYGADLN